MQRENPSPVSLTDSALLCPSRWENRLMWFPLVGWMIGGFLQYGRIGRARAEVHRQLERRGHFPAEAWKSIGVEPADAEEVARAIAARVGWPNHHFLPDDPLELLLLDEDGMGFFEASFAMKEELGVDVRPGAMPPNSNFRDVVAASVGARAGGAGLVGCLGWSC